MITFPLPKRIVACFRHAEDILLRYENTETYCLSTGNEPCSVCGHEAYDNYVLLSAPVPPLKVAQNAQKTSHTGGGISSEN
jgi:hypothetical protein